MSDNKKRYRRTIGKLKHNSQYDFFSGYINGAKVTMNKVKDRDGNEAWMISEELDLYEVQPKQTRDDEPFF